MWAVPRGYIGGDGYEHQYIKVQALLASWKDWQRTIREFGAKGWRASMETAATHPYVTRAVHATLIGGPGKRPMRSSNASVFTLWR